MHNAAARALSADYSMSAMDPHDEASFRAFCQNPGDMIGFCVTVPYKKVAYEVCDKLSPRAEKIGAVNTVTVLPDGTLYGENTDSPGFGRALIEGLIEADLIKPAVIPSSDGASSRTLPPNFSELSFLVRGTGGVARAIVFELIARRAGHIFILSRNSERAKEFVESFSPLAELCKGTPLTACTSPNSEEFDVFINASVLGLNPEDSLPLDESLLASGSVRYVFDAVYAKSRATQLVACAWRHGIPAQDGKKMLVYQGVIASSVWNSIHDIWASSLDAHLAMSPLEKEALVTQAMTEAMRDKPIVLVGFMGAGKTSVGRAVSKKTGRPFYDVDSIVEEATGETISQIFALRGEDDFRDEETAVLTTLLENADSAIIASGGGIVVREENRELLAEKAYVIYLYVPLEAALARVGSDETRPLLVDSEDAVEHLYARRISLYESVANQTIDASTLTADQIAEKIAALLPKGDAAYGGLE